MHKVLLPNLDIPLSREIARGLLGKGCQVLGFGLQETQLGSLKSMPGFTFQKVDLVRNSIVRSWLYGVSEILFIESGAEMLERMDKLFQSLVHLRSRIPRFLLVSSAAVLNSLGDGPHVEKVNLVDTEDILPLRGAEIMLANYSSHLDTPAAVLRVPKLVGQGVTDPYFKSLLQACKRLKRLDTESIPARHVQFLWLEHLQSAVQTLLGSKWSGLEIFHAVSATHPLRALVVDIVKGSNSACMIDPPKGFKDRLFLGLRSVPELARLLDQQGMGTQFEHSGEALLECSDSDRLFHFSPVPLNKLYK